MRRHVGRCASGQTITSRSTKIVPDVGLPLRQSPKVLGLWEDAVRMWYSELAADLSIECGKPVFELLKWRPLMFVVSVCLLLDLTPKCKGVPECVSRLLLGFQRVSAKSEPLVLRPGLAMRFARSRQQVCARPFGMTVIAKLSKTAERASKVCTCRPERLLPFA